MDHSLPLLSLPRARRQLMHTVPLGWLLVGPVLLALATAVVLFVHADVNVAMLFSQCQARARLHWLSQVPVLGPLVCFVVSFLDEAMASSRAFAVMSVVLAFLASLLTVSTVEAARLCNGPSILIAYPTGPWLVVDFLGGAVVWELVILPAFFRRAKELLAGAADAADGTAANGDAAEDAEAATPDTPAATGRHLATAAEVVAIPTGVALGFVLPSVLMLVLDAPLATFLWLFAPIYVSLLRQGVRRVIRTHDTRHLESHRPSLLAVYAVPVACSALAHGLLVGSLLAGADDRKEMTRSTLRFIEIDVLFIGFTVLYWLLVEVGWRVVLAVLAWSVVLGPGAGLCLGWIHREQQLGWAAEGPDADDADNADEEARRPGEETPLLR